MITQRDRLASALHDMLIACNEDMECIWSDHLRHADLLLSRGVRAIDRELLEEVTINRCADPDGADALCESCQQGAKALVAFLNADEVR